MKIILHRNKEPELGLDCSKGFTIEFFHNKKDIVGFAELSFEFCKDENERPKSTDPDRSWACPNCGAVHDPIDEHYLYCHFCGKGRF